ncbi:MAG: AmmeMemoRadiSam system protein B [Elusimicrobiales bacterium]
MITSDYKPLIKAETEIIPAKTDKGEVIILKDNEGLTNQTIVMPIETIALIQFFNGQNSIKDMQSQILKLTSHIIPEHEIIEFVKQLEEANFLESEKIKEIRIKSYEEFKKSDIRKAIHKGLSYPENILELTSFMSKFHKAEQNPFPTKTLTGAVAPHIDIIRGGTVYSKTYSEIANSQIPDLIIAFGVSHKGGNSPFIFTKKDYETPYGNMVVDSETYDKFKEILWYEPDDEEILHKNEHSLEFQALWLKYIWREKSPKWLPILVTDFERFSSEENPPSKIEYMEKFFSQSEILLKSMLKENKKILILAGVDLSHMGQRFGDDFPITGEIKKQTEEFDKKVLNLALELKADEFFKEISKNKNSTKICGLSAIYCALRFIKSINPQIRGKILDYSQANDPFGGFVSFASMIF